MTDQEREEIKIAIHAFDNKIDEINEEIIDRGLDPDLYKERHNLGLAIKALRRWLDEDREDREHDES